MKKIILMVVALIASTATFAQAPVGSISLKPQVGINGSTMTDFNNTKMKVGFVGGAELEYQATDIFSVSAGLLYSQQGVQFKDGYSGNLGGLNINIKDTQLKLDYINVPILANVYVVPGLAVKLGVQPGFLVNDHNLSAKSFDFSIPVGLSYEFSNVVIDGRYNWGVTKAWDNINHKNSVFQITLGYKFTL